MDNILEQQLICRKLIDKSDRRYNPAKNFQGGLERGKDFWDNFKTLFIMTDS